MTPESPNPLDTVIVGGSVAGIGVADELRRLGHDRLITIIDAQTHLPYDRPPLSKGVLTGAISPEELHFHDAEHYREAGIDLRMGSRARRLDAETRTVELESGEKLAARTVVIATGARPRPLAGVGMPVGLLREWEDAVALRNTLTGATTVGIIGGGFIGAEIASSATLIGLSTNVVELAHRPFESITGQVVAELILDLHRRAGVNIRCGVTVDEITQSAGGSTLKLSDGTSMTVDAVVAGLGAVPELEWLSDSGLDIDDGVACDAYGRTSAENVYAAGDVARWAADGIPARRHEHWSSAREQARIVAHAIQGVDGPRWDETIPYVWSDQHGVRIQVVGNPRVADSVEVVYHDGDTGAFLALYGSDDRLVAAVGCNRAAAITRQRALLASGASLSAALDAFTARPALPKANGPTFQVT